jgi:hypothetical protein
MRLMTLGAWIAFALWLSAIPCWAQNTDSGFEQSESEKLLLDRIMAAESGGRQFAKNPFSSALGPYQFIESTFLDIMRRKLPALTAGKSAAEISRLRVDPKISRQAALIYLRESSEYFAARNVPATPANLRLAYFVGQSGAIRVLAAKRDKPLVSILGPSVIAANPPLVALTAGQLIEKSHHEAGGTGKEADVPQLVTLTAGPVTEKLMQEADAAKPVAASFAPEASTEGSVAREPSQEVEDAGGAIRLPELPGEHQNIEVRCNIKLPSCRKWLALAERRLQNGQAQLSAALVDKPQIAGGVE